MDKSNNRCCDNANFEELINNFVESIMTMADNILPRIEIALDEIVKLILSLADTLLPKVLDMGVNLIQNLVSGITNNIGSLMASVNQIIQTVLNALIGTNTSSRYTSDSITNNRNCSIITNTNSTDSVCSSFNGRNIIR